MKPRMSWLEKHFKHNPAAKYCQCKECNFKRSIDVRWQMVANQAMVEYKSLIRPHVKSLVQPKNIDIAEILDVLQTGNCSETDFLVGCWSQEEVFTVKNLLLYNWWLLGIDFTSLGRPDQKIFIPFPWSPFAGGKKPKLRSAIHNAIRYYNAAPNSADVLKPNSQ